MKRDALSNSYHVMENQFERILNKFWLKSKTKSIILLLVIYTKKQINNNNRLKSIYSMTVLVNLIN